LRKTTYLSTYPWWVHRTAGIRIEKKREGGPLFLKGDRIESCRGGGIFGGRNLGRSWCPSPFERQRKGATGDPATIVVEHHQGQLGRSIGGTGNFTHFKKVRAKIKRLAGNSEQKKGGMKRAGNTPLFCPALGQNYGEPGGEIARSHHTSKVPGCLKIHFGKHNKSDAPKGGKAGTGSVELSGIIMMHGISEPILTTWKNPKPSRDKKKKF